MPDGHSRTRQTEHSLGGCTRTHVHPLHKLPQCTFARHRQRVFTHIHPLHSTSSAQCINGQLSQFTWQHSRGNRQYTSAGPSHVMVTHSRGSPTYTYTQCWDTNMHTLTHLRLSYIDVHQPHQNTPPTTKQVYMADRHLHGTRVSRERVEHRHLCTPT